MEWASTQFLMTGLVYLSIAWRVNHLLNSTPKNYSLVAILVCQHTEAADIRQALTARFGYCLNRMVDEIRPGYRFTEASVYSVQQALVCAVEDTRYALALRNAVSIGGDSPTVAAVVGSVAEAGTDLEFLKRSLPRPTPICHEKCVKY